MVSIIRAAVTERHSTIDRVQRDLARDHIGEPVQTDVLLQIAEYSRMGFESDYLTLWANGSRCWDHRASNVRAHVDAAIAGLQVCVQESDVRRSRIWIEPKLSREVAGMKPEHVAMSFESEEAAQPTSQEHPRKKVARIGLLRTLEEQFHRGHSSNKRALRLAGWKRLAIRRRLERKVGTLGPLLIRSRIAVLPVERPSASMKRRRPAGERRSCHSARFWTRNSPLSRLLWPMI